MRTGGEEARNAVLGRHLLAGATAVAVVVGLVVSPGGRGASVLPYTLAAILGLGALVVLERRQPLLRRPFVLGLALTLLLVALIVPPKRSRDIWQYAMYGRMVAVHDASPYTHVPSEFADDPAYQRIDPIWRNTHSLYGPGFTAASDGIARVVGTAELPTRLAYQGLTALAVAIAAFLVDRRTRDPMAVLLLVANPVMMMWTVNGAHNDALVGLGVLGAVLLAERRRVVWAGVALAAAVLVKAVAVLALLPLAWWLWSRRAAFWAADPTVTVGNGAQKRRGLPDWHRRLRAPAVLAAVTGLVTVAGYAVGGGTAAVDRLNDASGNTSWSSFWRPVAGWLATGDASPRRLSEGVGLLALAAVAGVVALLAAAGRDRPTPELAVAGGLAAYLVGAPYVIIWYLAWVLPLLCLRWRSRLTTLMLGFSALILLAAEGPADPSSITAWGFDGLLSALHLYEVAALLLLAIWAVTDLARRRPTAAPSDGRSHELGGNSPRWTGALGSSSSRASR